MSGIGMASTLRFVMRAVGFFMGSRSLRTGAYGNHLRKHTVSRNAEFREAQRYVIGLEKLYILMKYNV